MLDSSSALERKLDGQSIVGIKFFFFDGALSCQLDLIPEVALGRHTAAVSIVFRSEFRNSATSACWRTRTMVSVALMVPFSDVSVPAPTYSSTSINVLEVYPDEVGFSQQEGVVRSRAVLP